MLNRLDIRSDRHLEIDIPAEINVGTAWPENYPNFTAKSTILSQPCNSMVQNLHSAKADCKATG